jgi:hypothetical protein
LQGHSDAWHYYESQPVYDPTNPVPQPDPELLAGYSSAQSVASGETLNFYVSTTAGPDLTVTYVRLHDDLQQPLDGHYGDSVGGPFQYTTGQQRQLPATPYWEGAGWESGPADFSLTVPATWQSGLYAAQVVNDRGDEIFITFIVKPLLTDHNPIAVVVSTNTWNAYNNWGGQSQYSYPGAPGPYPNPPLTLSFLRPKREATPVLYFDGPYANGATVPSDVWLLTWLEDAGYSVDVYTDLDFDQGIPGLSQYRALVLDTHPEYWTVGEYQNLQTYLNQGGHLLSLGGNSIYEKVEYTPDSQALLFRTEGADRASNLFTTLGMPEINLLGVGYWGVAADGDFSAPYQVTSDSASNFLFQGSNLPQGSLIGQAGLFGGASGWETGQANYPIPSPPGTVILAMGTNPTGGADMIYYPTDARGFVFSVGSITFVGSLVVDPNLEIIVRNALNAAEGPSPPGGRAAVPPTSNQFPQLGPAGALLAVSQPATVSGIPLTSTVLPPNSMHQHPPEIETGRAAYLEVSFSSRSIVTAGNAHDAVFKAGNDELLEVLEWNLLR